MKLEVLLRENLSRNKVSIVVQYHWELIIFAPATYVMHRILGDEGGRIWIEISKEPISENLD